MHIRQPNVKVITLERQRVSVRSLRVSSDITQITLNDIQYRLLFQDQNHTVKMKIYYISHMRLAFRRSGTRKCTEGNLLLDE